MSWCGDVETHPRRRRGLPVWVRSCWGLAPGFCRDDRDGDGRGGFYPPRAWLKTPGWAGGPLEGDGGPPGARRT